MHITLIAKPFDYECWLAGQKADTTWQTQLFQIASNLDYDPLACFLRDTCDLWGYFEPGPDSDPPSAVLCQLENTEIHPVQVAMPRWMVPLIFYYHRGDKRTITQPMAFAHFKAVMNALPPEFDDDDILNAVLALSRLDFPS